MHGQLANVWKGRDCDTKGMVFVRGRGYLHLLNFALAIYQRPKLQSSPHAIATLGA